jgi:hypothetical protein
VPVMLVVIVLLASAWTPRRDSFTGGENLLTAVFRPVVKVSAPVLASVAAVMRKRLVLLGDGSSTAAAANGVINVRLVHVIDTQTVLEVLATPARLYFRPVLCDAPAYVAPTKGTKDAPSSTTRIPTCSAPYRYTSTDFSGSPSSSYKFPPEDQTCASSGRRHDSHLDQECLDSTSTRVGSSIFCRDNIRSRRDRMPSFRYDVER